QGRRDALLATIERGVEEQREQSETERAEQLQQARAAEQSVRTLLRSNHGKVLAEDVLYEPTGERIAQRGAKADATHAEALDRIAQEHRDLIVETTRKEMERVRAEAERKSERARMDEEGESTAIQDRLQAAVHELRARTEAQRRDLESLKK